MKKTLFIFLLPFAVFLFPSLASAQSRLTYPIPDLGYCRDAKECSLYCEIPENKAACWSYGKYKLGTDVLGITTMGEEEKRQMQQKAKQYNVVFPIADLGNCAGPQECRDFCDQPTNQSICMDFAKKKGFQKEVNNDTGLDRQKKDELLTKAQTELGCTSMETCSKICESDHTRCEAFARKHGVYQEPPQSTGRYSREEKMQLIEKAQSELGCTSMESCKSACEKNPQVCMAFAKKHGFDDDRKNERAKDEQSDASRRPEDLNQQERGAPSGISPNFKSQRFGEGGCDSEESCKKYCQEHPDECPGFQGYTRAAQSGSPTTITSPGKQSQGSYVGPSGCRNEAECENWCKGSPDKCPGFSEAKIREENSKRTYELRNKETERKQETQIRQYNFPPSGGPSGSGGEPQNYPTTSTRPAYQTTQPSSGSYTPPSTQPAAP